MKKNNILFALITLLITLSSPVLNAQDEIQKNQMKFGRLLRLIDGYYVDSANIENLTEKAIVHLLSELDPHSVYISREEVKKMNSEINALITL